MRDPHVERLFYRLRMAENVTYENPPPVNYDGLLFRAVLDQGCLAVEMKEHHPSEPSARARVDEWLRGWEIAAALTDTHNDIRFSFERSEIIDRDPPGPGDAQATLTLAAEAATFNANAMIRPKHDEYPSPPTGFKASPDVQIMWLRYEGYKERREPLLAMAYFCLTVIEGSTGCDKGARAEAANRYNVDRSMLKTIGELSSTKGTGQDARKFGADATKTALTPSEINWLETAIRRLIWRKAQYDYDPAAVAALPTLTMADQPTP